ncbi:MAG: type II toxin-antitoxin system VapC family toxin [Acidimicrobiales bacterium]|nr:type II toxin-antitoxin system VapC family toxin [Acidimicrobiales bacterium]
MAYYLDTSAMAKLVVAEAETAGLLDWIDSGDRDCVANDLARAELMRAVRRAAPDLAPRAREVLDAVVLVEVTSAVFAAAGRLEPSSLRTLDAVHVASALDLGDDLEALVTYDQRLADAANANGIRVLAPR